MHTDYDFPIKKKEELENWDYAYIGRSGYDYYFLYKRAWEYFIKTYYIIDDSDVSDRMWDDFDSKEEWIDAVRNWDTEESYDDWSNDVDIWEVKDWRDYVDCPYEIAEILADMDLWDDSWDIYYWWSYLDEYDVRSLTQQNLEWLDGEINDEEEFNEELWNDLTSEYHLKEIEFLDCENIR